MKNERKPSVTARLLTIAGQGKWILTACCAANAIATLAGILPYLSVYAIARTLLIPDGRDVRRTIMLWIVVAGIGIAVNMVCSFFGSFGAHKVAFKILYGLRIRLMEHIGTLSIGFFAGHTTGSIQKTMDDNIERIEGFIAHMLPDIIGSFCALVVLSVSLAMLNGWLALAILVAIVIAVRFQYLMFGGEKGKELWTAVAQSSHNITSSYSEYIRGIAEVKLFGMAGTITRTLEHHIDNYELWELRQYKTCAPAYSAYKTMILSLLTFVLPTGVWLMTRNPGDREVMLSVLMTLILTPAISDPFMTCLNYGTQMAQIGMGLDDIERILNIKPIPEPAAPRVPDTFTVEFHNVSFTYDNDLAPDSRMAVSDISFLAGQGQTTALVGPSGGGKSTIAQLICRFWDVNAGSITIGGIDLRDISTETLMDITAMVFQDTYLFADTVFGNITMNRPCSRRQVEQAAQAACCHDFIMQLPDGYQTRIGEGGTGLSGGEAQRIAIARAILKDAPIILLDEALAYADAENENLIHRAIEKLVRNKTVIIIAHRLQSIASANQILLLHSGRITERGTHSELIAADTEYRELWNLQHQADGWTIETEDKSRKEETVLCGN